MGDPKRHRKKFSTPPHPWQKERILAEKDILQKYGLRRKYEIWKMNTILKSFTSQAKNLIASAGAQADKERQQLLTKLVSLGLLEKNAKIEDVLALSLGDILERRLQTLVFRKELAQSLNQARQFIIHEHIMIGDKVIKAPSYLVPVAEESTIQFMTNSPLSDENHPERMREEKKEKTKKKTTKETKEAKKETTPKEKKAAKKTEKKEKKVKEPADESKQEPKSESKEKKTEEKKEE